MSRTKNRRHSQNNTISPCDFKLQKDLDELVKDEKVHKNDKAYIYCKTSIGTFYSKEVKDFKLSCPKNLVIDIV